MENEIIYLNVVAAADRILQDNPYGSSAPDDPAGLAPEYFYMVISGSAMDIRGEGTGSLSFTANQGDIFRVGMTNEFGNYRTSVFFYNAWIFDVEEGVPSDIFGGHPFRLESFPDIPTPYPVSYPPLETNINNQAFWFAENTFQKKGEARLLYNFAIYDTPRGEAPKLRGYYCWDPVIKVV